MTPDVALVAPGTVTIREWQQEPRTVSSREAEGYDRFAHELGEALGGPVRLLDDLPPGGERPDVLLLPVLHVHLSEAVDALERTLLLEASPSDQVQIVRGSMLGGLSEGALGRWRKSEPGGEDALFGRVAVAQRMPDPPALGGVRFGYAYLADTQSLPALTAAYLRAWHQA
jgi:hypothetical protein